jgi:hypothetical protein
MLTVYGLYLKVVQYIASIKNILRYIAQYVKYCIVCG